MLAEYFGFEACNRLAAIRARQVPCTKCGAPRMPEDLNPVPAKNVQTGEVQVVLICTPCKLGLVMPTKSPPKLVLN